MTVLLRVGSLLVAFLVAAFGLAAPAASATTAQGPAFVSDDFAAGVLEPMWSVVDPRGDGSVSFLGAGGGDVRLGLGVPAGVSHDAWQTNSALRVVQPSADVDFTAAVSFASVPSLRFQTQGLLVEQDAQTWLRFDVHHTGSTLRVFAGRTVGGVSTAVVTRNVTASGPVALRVSRAGSTWSLAYSSAGGPWVDAGSFTQAMVVNQVGPFAGNSGSNPAFTAEVDYVFDLAAPVSPEDGDVGQPPPGGGDTTAPLVSDVVVTPATNSATVAFSTDEVTTASVEFGPSAAYEFGSMTSPGSATSHSLALAGLVPGSVYHFRVTARDAAGNQAVTADSTFTTTASNDGGPDIAVWHGDLQVIGQTGEPQLWANVLGTASDPDGLQSLSYRLNGGPATALRWGPDLRRLARPGDFNVEIPYLDLPVGDHTVVITSMDRTGLSSSQTVTLRRVSGSAPLPFETSWATRNSLGEVGQVVDGPWSLVPGGVRAEVLAYDRTLALGDRTWGDVEVTVPVTVYGLGPDFGTPESGDPLIGLGLHWQGHTYRKTTEQPRVNFYPTGAFAWHRFSGSGRYELFGNDASPVDRETRSLAFGTTYVMKARAETVADGIQYSYKVWPAATTEPSGWEMQIVETAGPTTGSVLLIQHHVDAVFGDVLVTPLSGQTTMLAPTSASAVGTGLTPSSVEPAPASVQTPSAPTSTSTPEVPVPVDEPPPTVGETAETGPTTADVAAVGTGDVASTDLLSTSPATVQSQASPTVGGRVKRPPRRVPV